MGPRQYPRYTDGRKGRPWVAQKHHQLLQAANKTQTLARRRSTFVKHLHGTRAGSLKPQIYEATTELDDKIRLRVFSQQEPKRSGTNRKSRRRSRKRFRRRSREKHADNTFKVITYLRSRISNAEFDGGGYQEVDLRVTARSLMLVAKSSRTS